jgi:hypothetical protein
VLVFGQDAGSAQQVARMRWAFRRRSSVQHRRAMSLVHRSHTRIFAFRSTSKNLRAGLDCGVDEDFGGGSCV